MRYTNDMLAVSHVHKKFGSKVALNGVSFTVEPGEVYALIGPNGSGKTTLIKLIVGLMHPNKGTVTVNGFDVSKNPEKTKAAIGYMPDEPQVWDKITGEEFLHLTGTFFGMTTKNRTKRIKQLLPLFKLQGTEKEYFGSYSRGSRQKFSILAALMHKPKLLLIDEPMVGLDPTSAEIAKQLFKEHAEAGGSVLLVTHTLSVAEAIADKVGILEQGELKKEGTVDELRRVAKVSSEASLEEVFGRLVSK